MKCYIKNWSQEGRILKLLRERGDKGVFVYEIIAPRPEGLGVAQYNARILGLRNNPIHHFDIENVKPGHFVLHEAKRITDYEFVNDKPIPIYG